jgi:hypothetical protein
MEEFVSEPITPEAGTFDAGAMATGVPGLPRGFRWHGTTYQVAALLETWKATAPEGGRAGGEVYLRRHCFRLKMSDASTWTVYFTRQPLRGGSAKNRWFLYSVEPA